MEHKHETVLDAIGFNITVKGLVVHSALGDQKVRAPSLLCLNFLAELFVWACWALCVVPWAGLAQAVEGVAPPCSCFLSKPWILTGAAVQLYSQYMKNLVSLSLWGWYRLLSSVPLVVARDWQILVGEPTHYSHCTTCRVGWVSTYTLSTLCTQHSANKH